MDDSVYSNIYPVENRQSCYVCASFNFRQSGTAYFFYFSCFGCFVGVAPGASQNIQRGDTFPIYRKFKKRNVEPDEGY